MISDPPAAVLAHCTARCRMCKRAAKTTLAAVCRSMSKEGEPFGSEKTGILIIKLDYAHVFSSLLCCMTNLKPLIFYPSGSTIAPLHYSDMSLTNRKPLRVLAAVSHRALPLLSKALGDDFVLVHCVSIATAKTALHDAIDVIITGVNFDDSQMFGLLRLCKSSDHAKKIAFVCIKCLESEMEGTANEAFDIASRSLGGDGFIDLYRWTTQFGADQSFEELRNLIDTLVQFRRVQELHNPAFSRI